MEDDIDKFIRNYHDLSSTLDPYDLQLLGAVYNGHTIPSELREDINHALLQHADSLTTASSSSKDDDS